MAFPGSRKHYCKEKSGVSDDGRGFKGDTEELSEGMDDDGEK
jgi:hypothetical protein